MTRDTGLSRGRGTAAAVVASGSLHDPVGMEVFSNQLLSITEDMGNLLVRSSFSTNIKERRDCSVGLFDVRGRLIAQASHVPLHLGSLLGGVRAVLGRYDPSEIKEGDAFICNDPYLAGGTHIPDIALVTPVFGDGSVRFFTANIGHHSDFGGTVPGSISCKSRSIFEEGLRLPVIRLVREGRLDESLLNLIVQNTREPADRALDLRAQAAVNEKGAAMVRNLVARMGIDNVEQSIDDILTYTGNRLRKSVAELKDGSYGFTTYLDDDGIGGDPVPLQATVRVDGDSLEIDFTGSGVQTRGAMNVTESALHATVFYSVKTLLCPELLPNSGFFDAIKITSPEGTITRPRFPSPVGARSITCQKIAGAIFGAFRGLLPEEKVMASGNDLLPAMVFSGPYRKRPGTYVYVETIGGGSGARYDTDGMDCVHVHVTNTSNLPAEALEHEYTLRVDEYACVVDSGGPGRRRGGTGIARQIRSLHDDTIFSVRSDSHFIGAAGVDGGHEGGKARLIQNSGTPCEDILSSRTANLVLPNDQSMRLETPGGGGYGPPTERSLALIARDMRDGKTSHGAAERAYGAELVAQALAADGNAPPSVRPDRNRGGTTVGGKHGTDDPYI